jgi:hypothetical protein
VVGFANRESRLSSESLAGVWDACTFFVFFLDHESRFVKFGGCIAQTVIDTSVF